MHVVGDRQAEVRVMQARRLIRLVLVSAFCVLVRPAFAGEYVLYYHNDALGSPQAMTDINGNVVWRADYEPFGDLATITETLPNTHEFIGKERDPETSLHYFGARFYDGGIGRFLSVDPILLRGQKTNVRFSQRLNMYVYGTNNPYRFIDPKGLDILDASSGEGEAGPPSVGDEGGNRTGDKDPDPLKDPETQKRVLECFLKLSCAQDPTDFFGPLVIPGVTGPGNLRNVSSKEADKIAQDKGFKNAEDMKTQELGPDRAGKHNVKVDKSTGEIVFTPVRPGSGPNVPSGMFHKK